MILPKPHPHAPRALAIAASIALSACPSAAPRWTAAEARALKPAPTAPAVMAFPVEQPADAPADEQFSDDYVPERDVATAELAARIEAAARALDAIAAERGGAASHDDSSFAAARRQLEDARLAEAALRSASLPQWKSKRALATSAVFTLEQHVVALRAASTPG